MTVTDQGVVAFELERFVAAGRRLEVTGRWRGVRGRRFMRPTLTIEVDGGEMRALAELEHKPWAPEQDRDWTAAFEWSGEWRGVEQFELAVAPDIAVYLPAPAPQGPEVPSHEDDPELVLAAIAPAADGRSPDVKDREEAGSQRRRGQAAAELKGAFAARNEAIEQRDVAVAESERLAAECERLMDEHDRLVGRSELMVAQRDTTVDELAGVVQERDHALRELAAMIEERDNAATELADAIPTRERAAGELASAVEARDRAVSAVAAAAAERDRAVRDVAAAGAERDRAVSEVAAAGAERDRAVRDVAAAGAERDRAVSEVAAAGAERDRAVSEVAAAGAERDRAIAEHQQAAGELRDLREQLARVRRELSAQAPPPIPAPLATPSVARVGPARVVRPAAAGERRRSRAGRGHLATRLFALAALIVFVVVLLMILTSR